MGRKGSRYALEEKLFYIGLILEKGWELNAVRREYGANDGQVKQWIECFGASDVDGLKHRRVQQKSSS